MCEIVKWAKCGNRAARVGSSLAATVQVGLGRQPKHRWQERVLGAASDARGDLCMRGGNERCE